MKQNRIASLFDMLEYNGFDEGSISGILSTCRLVKFYPELVEYVNDVLDEIPEVYPGGLSLDLLINEFAIILQAEKAKYEDTNNRR